MDDSLKPKPSIPWKTDLPLKKLTHPRETQRGTQTNIIWHTTTVCSMSLRPPKTKKKFNIREIDQLYKLLPLPTVLRKYSSL